MKKRISLILLVVITASYQVFDENNDFSSSEEQNVPPQIDVSYVEFKPNQVEGVELKGYDVEEIYRIDSSNILTAYSDGDLISSNTPTNWGDRLIMMRKDTILFESKPVGDPYLYKPNFYRNTLNNKVIIICQLGNEETYGGEAFLFEKGAIKFIGKIEIESPLDTPENNSLIDIV